MDGLFFSKNVIFSIEMENLIKNLQIDYIVIHKYMQIRLLETIFSNNRLQTPVHSPLPKLTLAGGILCTMHAVSWDNEKY